MKINLSNYYNLDSAKWWRGHNGNIMYIISLVSNSTGEVIDLTFDSTHFDMLLKEMEYEVSLKRHAYIMNKTLTYKEMMRCS